MKQENEFIKNKDKIYNFIWFGFLFELAMFFVAEYFFLLPEVEKEKHIATGFGIFILYLSYLVVIISVPATYKIYEIRKKEAAKENNVNRKSEIYFFTLIIIFFIFEFAATLSLVASFINAQSEPLYMFGIVFVAVLLNKPSLKNFILSGKEFKQNNVISDYENKASETDKE